MLRMRRGEDRIVQHSDGVIKFATQRVGSSVKMKSTYIPVELTANKNTTHSFELY
jgi:hypothetical protein